MMRGVEKSNRPPVWLVGLLALVLIGFGTELYTLVNSGPPSFSPLVYASSVPAKPSSALTQCPNPKGLIAFTPITIALAGHETYRMTVRRGAAAKADADPSYWSSLAIRGSGLAGKLTPQFPRQEIIKGVPSAPGAAIVASSCGRGLLAKTVVIDVVPLTSSGVRGNCNDCMAHFYYVDRLGHALLYWVS